MTARASQSAHPCSCAHAKVFTKVFASTSMLSFTRFVSCGHLTVNFLVGDRIVLLNVFSDSGCHVECHGQKRLESSRFGCTVKSRTSWTSAVATMMYDSSVISSPPHIGSNRILCLCSIYLLAMLPQGGVVTIVGSGDEGWRTQTRSSLSSCAVATVSKRARSQIICL